MDPEVVEARKVLLDVLQALDSHRAALVLVGAQAIYLHVGGGGLAVEPYTRDGDVLLDPRRLEGSPPLLQTLADAGFNPAANQPGRWVGPDNVIVDLMVPEALGGGGCRAARLPDPHGSQVARKARGLEATIVDTTEMELSAFDPADDRIIAVKVASVGGLLVAKLHKVYERKDDADRRNFKDALDILRILRGRSTEELSREIDALRNNGTSSDVTNEALLFLDELFRSPDSAGSKMAAAAVGDLEDADEIAASCSFLAQDLLDAVRILRREGTG